MLLARSVHPRVAVLLSLAALIAPTAACGGAGDDTQGQTTQDAQASPPDGSGRSTDQSGDDMGEELAGVLGAGGGGTLVFDGEEIVIESVTCQTQGDDFAVGTVSDSGYRVLIDSSSTGTPSSQILDPDLNQWTPVDRGASVVIGDGTYSSPPTSYTDIRDSSREVEVSYSIDCP